MADVQTAPESSTGQPEAQVQDVDLSTLSADDYSHWRETGEIRAPKAEESPTSETNQAESSPVAESAPAEQKGTQETGKGKGVTARKREIDAEIQDLERSLARRAELRAQLAEKPAEAKPAEAAKPTTDDLKPPVEPDFDSIQDWAEYQKAIRQYVKDVAEYNSKAAVREFANQQRAEAQRVELEKAQKVTQERWLKGVNELAKEVGEDSWNMSADAIAPYVKEPAFRAIADFMLESDQGAKLSHYLGSNLDKLEPILAMSPQRQAVELARIEATLSLREKPKAAPPGPKKNTEAPPPPPDLQGRNQNPHDPVLAAIEAGDTEAYIREMNARDSVAGRGIWSR